MIKQIVIIFTIMLHLIFSAILVAEENEWTYLGLSGKLITRLAISPHNPSVMYVGTFYNGLHKSLDG